MEVIVSQSGNNTIKKWHTIKFSSNGGKLYVIRVKKKDGATKLTIFPHEKQENKLTQYVWYYLLRMLVFLRII